VRTLSQRELNRALLARQLLLERAPTPLPRALERIGGIQAQYAPSMYVGLWARLEGFDRDTLTRALERRSVIQATLMRHTIHLVSKADYWPIAHAVREARRTQWLRTVEDAPSPEAMVAAARELREALDGGSRSRKEIEALLGKPRASVVGLWIDLVRVPPSGTWERRRADLYCTAEDWLGEPDRTWDADSAVDHLVRSALRGFGPMPAAEVVSFTGLRAPDVAASLARLDLRRFRDEQDNELVDLPRAPLPDPETPAPVRFLPVWDATVLQASIRRTGIFPEQHRNAVTNSFYPQGSPLFLVDGVAAGTWKFEKDRVTIGPFEKLDRSTMRELREEADRLAEFHR
jgi:hypothetical protein